MQTGLETSELLVSKGNKVTVVEMADKIAPGAWFQQLDDALPVLEKAGTEFLTSHKLLSVSSSGIELENLKENKAVAAGYLYPSVFRSLPIAATI